MAAPCHGPGDKASGFGGALRPPRFGMDRPVAGSLIHIGTSLIRDSPFKPAAHAKARKWHGN